MHGLRKFKSLLDNAVRKTLVETAIEKPVKRRSCQGAQLNGHLLKKPSELHDERSFKNA